MDAELVVSSRARKILIWLVAGSFFMEMLDGTILNNAVPTLAVYFGRSPFRMQMVLVAYLLTAALFIPISGWMADRFGTKKVFFSAISLFTTGSFLCAMAPTFEMLIVFRILQGLGGAMMVPVGRLIVLKTHPRSELVQAMSIITIPALVGPLVGPTLGGLILKFWNWHWLFLINIPVGVVAAILTYFYLPDIKREKSVPFDWIGFYLFGGATVLISLAVDGAGELHLRFNIVLLFLVLGLAHLVGYWFFSHYAAYPLFSPNLFRIRCFSIGVAGNLFARLANGAIPFLIPLLLQVSFGYTPLAAGLTMIPLSLAAISAKAFVRFLPSRMGYRRFLLINTCLLGIMIGSFVFVTKETPYVFLLIHLCLLGTVNSMQFTAMNALALYDLTTDLESSGNSILSVVIQVATSMGVASAATLLVFYTHGMNIDLHANMLSAFHKTFFTVGSIAFVAAFIFLGVPGTKGKLPTEDV